MIRSRHTTTRDSRVSTLGFGPVRSPLLGASGLVSLPPLNDMLKFSGFPRRRHRSDVPSTPRVRRDRAELSNGLERTRRRAVGCSVHGRLRLPSGRALGRGDVADASSLRPRARRGRRCIRMVIDSRNLAIRNTFRISLRPSSTREPSRPPRMLSEPRRSLFSKARLSVLGDRDVPIMILSQVHLRKPCYDFSFLYVRRFRGVPRTIRCYPADAASPSSPAHATDGATGGVYKGQGPNHRRMLTCDY